MDDEEPMLPQRAIDDRIRSHSAEILAFLRRRAPADAEEIAQEVWLRVARKDPDCPTDAHFRAYAYTVARRLLVDHHRRRAARIRLVPLEGPDRRAAPHRPDQGRHADDLLGVVEAALADMKPELADVFRWRTASDLTFQQIAVRQGCSINTALGRMHQAVRHVRRALDAAGLLPGDPS